MQINLKINKKNINDVYFEHLTNDTPTQIFYGGSSSGKSVFLAQRCVIDLCGGNRNYLCVRNVQKTMRSSMFNEICKIIKKWKLYPYFNIRESDLTITYNNEYQILFAGLDDVEKVKSITPKKGIITDIWVEEGTETLGTDIKQLEKRLRGKSKVSKRLTISFNPILQSHWLYKTYFGLWEDDGTTYNDKFLSILKTTYKDNLRFLTQQDVDRLENEKDKYFYEVYALGNWGVLGNVIFKNWEMRDLKNEMVMDRNGNEISIIETFDNYKNGLDFGFAADPDALVRTHYNKKYGIIYITDELYEREQTNDILAKELSKIISREYVVCDLNEPRARKELQRCGIMALPAKKGKDSVTFGIDWLQRQKIIVDIRCQHMKNELQQYKWKEDKNGNVLREPVKKNDHLLDALRYAYEDEMTGREVKAVKSIM